MSSDGSKYTESVLDGADPMPCSAVLTEGRPIREQTQDGEDLVAFVVRVFRGEVEGVSCATGSTPRPGSPTAASGSPPRAVELAGKDGEPLLSLALIQAVVADAERAGTG